MYEIEFAPGAREDLKTLRKVEQVEVLTGIETQLRHEPTVGTRNRKRLEPNEVAKWELRIGRVRGFYEVEEQVKVVRIEAIGFKAGNELFIRGERREL